MRQVYIDDEGKVQFINSNSIKIEWSKIDLDRIRYFNALDKVKNNNNEENIK